MPDRSRKRPHYTVSAVPEGKLWYLTVVGRPELYTQARHAGEIEYMVRSHIANADDVAEDSFDLTIPQVDDRLIRPSKRPRDVNQLAKQIVDEATGQTDALPPDTRDPLAVELGRRGGLKGGKARAAKLSPERRQEIAKRAAARRWEKPASD